MARTRLMKRVFCAVPLVGAMAFGAAQAFASPTPPPEKANACTTTSCRNFCGGPGGCVDGICICF